MSESAPQFEDPPLKEIFRTAELVTSLISEHRIPWQSIADNDLQPSEMVILTGITNDAAGEALWNTIKGRIDEQFSNRPLTTLTFRNGDRSITINARIH